MKLKHKLMPMLFAGLALPIVIAVPALTVAMKTSNDSVNNLATASLNITNLPMSDTNLSHSFYNLDKSGFIQLVKDWISDLHKDLKNYSQTKIESWYQLHEVDAKKLINEVDESLQDRIFWFLPVLIAHVALHLAIHIAIEDFIIVVTGAGTQEDLFNPSYSPSPKPPVGGWKMHPVFKNLTVDQVENIGLQNEINMKRLLITVPEYKAQKEAEKNGPKNPPWVTNPFAKPY